MYCLWNNILLPDCINNSKYSEEEANLYPKRATTTTTTTTTTKIKM